MTTLIPQTAHWQPPSRSPGVLLALLHDFRCLQPTLEATTGCSLVLLPLLTQTWCESHRGLTALPSHQHMSLSLGSSPSTSLTEWPELTLQGFSKGHPGSFCHVSGDFCVWVERLQESVSNEVVNMDDFCNGRERMLEWTGIRRPILVLGNHVL